MMSSFGSNGYRQYLCSKKIARAGGRGHVITLYHYHISVTCQLFKDGGKNAPINRPYAAGWALAPPRGDTPTPQRQQRERAYDNAGTGQEYMPLLSISGSVTHMICMFASGATSHWPVYTAQALHHAESITLLVCVVGGYQRPRSIEQATCIGYVYTYLF